MISAVVLTKNEEKNILPCLRSLEWCDEIIIIDDFSQDRTIEKLQMTKGKWQIYQRHLEGNFAGQRNFGLKKAKGEWVLFVDADERVSPALAEEIKSQISNKSQIPNPLPDCRGQAGKSQIFGFYLKRRDYFGGRWLKYGETGNIKLLRLARKNAGKWQRPVHEVWRIKGRVGELKNSLKHYPHQTVEEFLRKIDFYSTLHAQALEKEGVRPSVGRIIFYPLGKFLKNYCLKLGFLDGVPGLIVALMMAFHSFLAQSKLYLRWKK